MTPSKLPACTLIAGYSLSSTAADATPRPKGRPKTRTSEYYLNLFKEYQAIEGWFASVTGRAARSDHELLTMYFTAQLEAQNMRASRLAAKDFKGKLKTLRNKFSTARQVAATHPEKAAIHGTDHKLQTSMQQRTLTAKEVH